MLPPPIDAARPRFCPGCGVPAGSRGALNLSGHGARSHEVVVPGDTPTLVTVWVRRFLCRRCNRTCSVLPPGCLPRHLYTLGAIVMAWFLAAESPVGDGLDDEAVYDRVGVDRRASGQEPGRAGRRRWRSLRRWLHPAACWWPTRHITGSTWRQQVAALLVGFVPGEGGREGATRRAVSAHVAGGTVG